jgi:hypothetical protein
MMCSEVEARNFTTYVYNALQSVGKSVLKIKKTMQNSLIIANDVWTIHINSIVIAVTSSEETLEALLSYRN